MNCETSSGIHGQDTLNVESNNETFDNLEVDQLYSSDEDNKYFLSAHNDTDDDDEEERDAVNYKEKRGNIFNFIPIKDTASACSYHSLCY